MADLSLQEISDGLVAAIRDPEVPIQYSPLLMAARKRLNENEIVRLQADYDLMKQADRDKYAEIVRLEGTLRYIAAQAKAGHAGALRVIQSNAEAAINGSLCKMQAAAISAGDQK